MRGEDEQQGAVFSYVSAEQRIAADHPLRGIRAMTDAALRALSGEFDRLYAAGGRRSIAPEKLLRALLLQVLYGRRSERLLMEEMQYNLLFRWFVGLEMDDRVWDVTVFTKNRERLLRGEIAQKFLQKVIGQGGELLSDEHFTVDGTLLEAWASRRSFEKKPDPPERGTGARGRKLLRDTHESKTDPEARLFRCKRAGESRASYLGHVLTENRYGLVVAACVTQSGKRAEREAALTMLDRLQRRARRITLGADKSYQEEQFIAGLGRRGIVPHVAEYEVASRPWPKNWLRAEERNDPGFARSQQRRKRVEQVFGWLKQAAGLRQVKLRGQRRVEWMFQLAVAALNLRRLQRLLPAAV